MKIACLFVVLLLGFSSLTDAAVCYKTRVASGNSVAMCTLNGGAPSSTACNSAGSIPYDNAVAGTKDAKALMLWGCTVEGNPWLAYSVVPTTATNIWVTVGYNFACMNNAIHNALPDLDIKSSSFNAGTAANPPVWTKESVTWPSSNWNPAPSYPSSITNCLTRTDGAPFFAPTTNISWPSVTSCNLATPVQVPSASTPICLMIICGSSSSSVGCGFKATIKVGTDPADALLQSSAAFVPIWASLVALLVSLFMF